MIWTSLIAQGKRQLWMSVLVATLVAVVYYHFARFYQGSLSFWLFVAGSVPILLNWLRAAIRLYSHLDRHPFRVLDLGLADDHVAPGQAFEITIRAETRRAIELETLSAELRCTRQRSTDRARKKDTLASEVMTLEQNTSLPAESSRTYTAALLVPADAPYSFRSMEGKISWSIHVALSVQDWGEVQDELGVMVAPR